MWGLGTRPHLMVRVPHVPSPQTRRQSMAAYHRSISAQQLVFGLHHVMRDDEVSPPPIPPWRLLGLPRLDKRVLHAGHFREGLRLLHRQLQRRNVASRMPTNGVSDGLLSL
jgi:hypothetical protein